MFGFGDAAVAAGLSIIDKFIPDPQAKIAAEAALRDALLGVDKAQMQVNAAEAASPSLFVAGWRPAVGWCCTIAMAWSYIVQPVAVFTLAQFDALVTLPTLDLSTMMPVLLGMLGMGGLRTYEKTKGVAAK
jgi:hypothetical protein